MAITGAQSLSKSELDRTLDPVVVNPDTVSKKASIKDGKYIASTPPFGYKRIKLENSKGFSLEPNLEEADNVKLIFKLFAYDGLSIREIANKQTILDKLNEENYIVAEIKVEGTDLVTADIEDEEISQIVTKMLIEKVRKN